MKEFFRSKEGGFFPPLGELEDPDALHGELDLSGIEDLASNFLESIVRIRCAEERIGEESVVGARSSVFSDLPAWKVCVGSPAKPVVREGDAVKRGDIVGAVEDGQLGCHVHASIEGRVQSVGRTTISITA